MKTVFSLLAAMLFLSSGAQQQARAFRVKVRYADPWMIKALLEGQALLTPEISTALAFTGAPAQAGQAVGGLFTRGHFVVNPTDNSLWWFPDRIAS